MNTEIIDVETGVDNAVNKAVELLKNGEIVALHTDTVYGVATVFNNDESVKNLYMVKNRPFNKPFSILVKDVEMAERIADVTPKARQLFTRYRGNITLILSKKDVVSDIVTAGLKTVGIRIPNDEVVNAIITKLDTPIVASSANLSGGIAPTTAIDVNEVLGGKIPLIIDKGRSEAGEPSTIVDITTAVPRILREGPAPIAQVLRDLNN